MSKKKKQKTVVSYQDYKNQNGAVVSFSDFKKNQQRENSIREQQERMDAARAKLQKKQAELEESRSRTKEWQERYNKAQQNGGNGWEVYAAKMMSDTPGAIQREQKKLRDASLEQTKSWQQAYNDAKNSGTGDQSYQIYAAKMMGETPVTAQERKKYGSDSNAINARWTDFLVNEGIIKKPEPTSPVEKYEELPTSQKAKRFRPYSKMVQNITSVDAAKKYANDYTYDLAGTQRELENWQKNLEEAKRKLAEETDKFNQERDELGPEGIEAAKQGAFDLKGKVREGYLQQIDLEGLENPYSTNQWKKEYLRKRPEQEEYEGHENEYDALIYDAVHGDGAYDKFLMTDMSDEEYDRFENEIDDLWKRLENGTLSQLVQQNPELKEAAKQERKLEGLTQGQSDGMRAAQSDVNYAQDRIKELNAEIKFLTGYDELMGGGVTLKSPDYIPENDRGKTIVFDNMDAFDRGVVTNDVHRIYSFINGGNEFKAWMQMTGGKYASNEYSGTLFMKDAEIAKFNEYYNLKQYDEAREFLKGLQPYLNQRYRPFEEVYHQEGAKAFPGMVSIGSQMGKVADQYLAPAQFLANLMGDETTNDPNSNWYATSRMENDVESTIAKDLGAYGQTYLVGMNSLRNVINGLTSGGSKAKSLLQFASQIYQDSTYKYLNETHDYNETRGLAFLDAIMETAEELLPYDTMLDKYDASHPFISFIKNGLSEAGEEFTGATIGEYVKGLITGRNSLEKRSDEILHNGGYYDNAGKWVALNEDQHEAIKQADTKAFSEWAQNVKDSVIAGFAGGQLGGLYGAINYYGETFNTGRRIKSENNRYEGQSGLQRIVDLAAGMKEGTQSRAIAEEMQERIAEGEKISNYETGKLAQTLAQETGAEQTAVAMDTIKRSIRDQLVKDGVSAEQAKEYAGIITNSLTSNGKMSQADMKKLSESRSAIELWQTYNSNTQIGNAARTTLQENIYNETAPQRSIMNTLDELARRTVKGNGVMAEEIALARRGTKTTQEAIDNLQKQNSLLVSEEYADKMKEILEKDARAQKSKTYIDDAMTVRMAAMTYSENMPKTNLDKDAAQELYDMAVKERDEADAMRLESNPEVVPGKGTAAFNGAEYGTDAWKEQIKELQKNVRNQMGAVAMIAKQFGHNVQFINDEERGMVNGWEVAQDGTVVINVATGMRHSMMATLAHELTHWLEHNSAEGYNALRQFQINNLRKNGANVEQMIMNTIRNQQRVRIAEEEANGESSITDLDFSSAMAELVAKSSEDIFSSQEVKEAIAKADPGLYQQIKNHVRNVVARIDSALEAAGLPSLEARILRNVRDEMAHLWLEAHTEAANREQEETNGIKNDVSYSIIDTNGNKVVLTEKEIQDNKKSISTMNPVATVDENKFGKDSSADFKTRAMQYFDTIGNIARSDVFGDIALDENGIQHLIGNLTARRAGLLAAVKPVIEKGQVIDIAEKGKHHNFDSAMIAAPVKYKGETYYMAVVIKQNDEQEKSYYVHDAILALSKEGSHPALKSLSNQTAGSNPTIAMVLLTIPQYNGNSGKKSFSVATDEEQNVIQNESGNESISYAEAAEEKKITVNPGDDPVDIVNDNGVAVATILPGNTVAATQFSLSSYYDLNERKKMINALTKAGYTEKEISKWIESLDNIAAKIASDRTLYDFVADRTKKFLKPNGDVYKKTIDANTMCKKTRLYNGTFNVVQHMLPNTILLPEDLIQLYNLMKDKGLETPCKFCYVQSRRRHLGTYAQEWLNNYKGEYIPRVEEVTTNDGLANLKEKHPKAYKDFVKAMNKKGVNNPKLVQERTDYRGEIRRMKQGTVDYLNRIGGLRIQSFSDFETVHMLDMMQVVMDMKAKGLTGQAYTKVPEFAWVFGGTGIKINLSLVGRGQGYKIKNGLSFDELSKMSYKKAKGMINLVHDNEEGIDYDQAMQLRQMYSKDVGTIIVGINDEHIIASMADDSIDFIIPFHKSGWSENELKHMRGLEFYSDYTDSQNEYNITTDEDGNQITVKAENNLDPLSYWEFDEDGEYNARKYLQQCKDMKIVPKFAQFLVDNGDGSWSLPEGNDFRSTAIREGYWKTLIDFKMYDNEGNGAKQMPVQPNFNMEQANRILDEYDGSHQTLPESWETAKEFVKKYKKDHPLDNERTQYSVEQAPDMDVDRFMMGLDPFRMNTVQEKVMLQQYKELKGTIDALRFKIYDRGKTIQKLENKPNQSVYDREQLRKLRNIQKNDQERMDRVEKEMIRVTKDKGYAKMMYSSESVMKDLVSGRTAGQLQNTVGAMNDELENISKEMETRAETLKALAEKDAVLKVRQMFNRAGLKNIAAKLKSDIGSDVSTEAIENRLALIALKMKQGQFDKETTMELADMIVGKIKQKYDSYILNELRGSTIVISPIQLKELKAQNKTLADIQAELAGTGIRVSTKGNTTLDEKWEDLCKLIPSLDPKETATNQLDALMNIIRNEKRMTGNDYGSDENMLKITEKVLESARDLMPEIVKGEQNLKQIREVLQFVQEISSEAKSAAEGIEEINALINRLKKTSVAANLTAGTLSGNIQDAIKYFNELAEQSEAAMWKKERIKLIDQLKSENTQALLEEQAKWKAKIEKDKTARGMMQSNLQLRKAIHTNISRVKKLLINETDQQNIPEHMKSLARYMVKLVVENDLVNRKITGIDRKDLAEAKRVLDIMEAQDGMFGIDDLRMIDDEEAQAAVAEALADLEDGIGFYNASTGKDIISNLQAFHNSLDRISEAVSTITSVINAERSLSFMDRKMDVADGAEMIRKDFNRSKFRGELKGHGSKAITTAKNAVVYGNMTPVYFFKNLRNAGMDLQWQEMERGENRNGLEMQKAKDYLDTLAEKTDYKEWENEKKEVVLGGRKQKISVQNMMELYAIWRREQTTNPEMSQHLTKGGVFIQEEEEENGKLRHERTQQRAVRITDDEVLAMYDQLTAEQKEYLDGIVRYLSNEMSALGNEASMRMYGIKKYKESYYFPMKVWDGVKSARSDKGITGTDENRAAHKSWSKRRMNMARNALVIGNFTQDAVKHIVEMINYNTMAPAIENINKVLNYQFTEGMKDEETKRNMRVMFQEAYGRDALAYLETLMRDLNGGAVQDQRKTLRDRALSMFKKNAVAGSLSVALQQPLSYIRAAMMVNPKYLAQALNPVYWKGSYREMMEHSGVGVIKNMGRFDMNFGQSAKDYITPEGKNSVYGKISNALTIAPEMMDRMTWTRMWSAVKLEQHKLHPEMDINSDKFLDMVGERFNELMRRTQVYDSVLVKSSNMRSQNLGLKIITSFMAEPTLSLNVLADAIRNYDQEKGLTNIAKAGSTFMLSAVMQAVVKGLMGAGRNPDDKKTWDENVAYRFWYNFWNEVNPLSLIPGYSDLIEVLKTGELKDDAMGAIGKLFSVWDATQKALQGKGRGTWRDIEDTAAQVAQLFTNIPAKNLMRDVRAMYNFFTQPYAKRENSGAILKNQREATFFNADNMIGTINKLLGDAGFKTTNNAYYERLYNAMKNGNEQEANEIREYMQTGKGVKEDTIAEGIKKAAKADDSLSAAERTSWMIEEGLTDDTSTVTNQYRDGKINRKDAEKLLKQLNPKLTDNEIWWKLDLVDYKKETGDKDASGYYYRLTDAVNANKADQIKSAVDDLLKHGITKEKIKKKLSDWKKDYMEADSKGKIKIRDALQKAYKAAGYTAEDANKTIDGWTKEKKKK